MVPTSPLEMGGGQVVPLGHSAGVPQRGMRPAGAVGPSRQVAPVGVLDVMGNSAVRPLSAKAVEFSPGPRTDVMAGLENVSSRAGIVAPTVVADFPVPAGAGVRFSAVAEVHASASEVDEDTLVVQASEQHNERNINPGKVPRVVSVPTAGASVSESLEHSVRKVDLDGRPMEGVLVLEHSVLDVSPDGGPMEGDLDLEPLEHSVSEEDQTGRFMEGDIGLEPLEHSLLDVNLVSQLRQDELDSGPLEHSVPDHTPSGGAALFGKLTVSDPLEHLGLIVSDDVVPKSGPSEPLEHSVPEGPQSRVDGLVSEVDTTVHLQSVCLPRVASDKQRVDGPLLEDRSEATGSRSETGEAIVVGAIGSAAPWFLIGWTHDVEVEFIIDTGCEVTILSTTVFERMCTLDPKVRSELRPCRRRLVSADSSPLIVQGELELSVVFPGLCCYLWWAEGWSTLQLHQQRLAPELNGFLTTSVVIPPDSEIVAPFSVSGIRPNGCALVEPSRILTEEYGVAVGHTLVDASS